MVTFLNLFYYLHKPRGYAIKRVQQQLALLVKKRIVIPLVLPLVVLSIWLMIPPPPLFPNDYSTVITDRRGVLLRAQLTADAQFRFPMDDTVQVPEKYKKALISYEDRTFQKHPGVHIPSLIQSVFLNIRKGKRIRGGSTITMQVIRLSQKNKRTYAHKIKEIAHALRLERHRSKEDILRYYATHAPMGGNIVGVPAACYRYFGKPMEKITWSEAALLAVLPNAPGLIHTERNRKLLKNKRNRLLKTLHSQGEFDTLTYELACAEPIPRRKRLPFIAPHFTTFVSQISNNTHIKTTLDQSIQRDVERELQHYIPTLRALGIGNCAALICERKSGQVLAYCGSANYSDSLHDGCVDGVQALRSPGSLIKPILSTALFDRGPFTPQTRIYDIPTFFGTYAPQNASKEFYGMVTLKESLIRSLNIPYIRLLNYYGLEDFYLLLKEMGVSTLNRPHYSYGLPLILGAFETSLWDLTTLYLTLANKGKLTAPHALLEEEKTECTIFTAAATEMTEEILQTLTRPGEELYWEEFNRQLPIAWKTGTSWGRKDGWAIGYTDQFVIAVWTGNFSGRGNAAIGGAATAAPLMFSLFNTLTMEKQSYPIFKEGLYQKISICSQSGYLAGRACQDRDTIAVPNNNTRHEKICPYHKRYHIDPESNKSVCSLCWEEHEERSLFIISPPARLKLQQRGIETDSIPAHKNQCPGFDNEKRMSILYPVEGTELLTPRNYQGVYEKSVLRAAHQREEATLFWYIDGIFRGETSQNNHTLALDIPAGDHTLLIEDDEGYSRQIKFTSFRN